MTRASPSNNAAFFSSSRRVAKRLSSRKLRRVRTFAVKRLIPPCKSSLVSPNSSKKFLVSRSKRLISTDTYIEKDLAINDEIDKLRLRATSALLSGRQDVIVVSSVSCIYGMGNPAEFYNSMIEVHVGMKLDRNVLLRRLVDSLYTRNDLELNRGNFRVKGDTVDIYLAYADEVLRIQFWDDEIDAIEEVDPVSGMRKIGRASCRERV